MHKHPHFDLLLHDDGELAGYINGPVYQRVTLHEWPLSCVQRVVHYDARRFIYKAQSGPTVEADFYAAALSKLLVGGRTIYREGPYTCLLLENLEAPPLASLGLPEVEALRVGRDLLDEIARIGGKYPVYLDVSSPAKWTALVVGKARADPVRRPGRPGPRRPEWRERLPFAGWIPGDRLAAPAAWPGRVGPGCAARLAGLRPCPPCSPSGSSGPKLPAPALVGRMRQPLVPSRA